MQVKLIKSLNGATSKQKSNARSLKLSKIGDIVSLDINNVVVLGRLKVIMHLVKMENK